MANKLSLILNSRDTTQEQLAKYLQVTPATVSRWCSNTSQPSIEKLYLISSYLKVEMSELLYGITKSITVRKTLELRLLEANDVYLQMVMGSSDLINLQKAMFIISKRFPDGSFQSYPISLLGYSSINRPVHIPLIEIGEIITDCQYSTLDIENCHENLHFTFQCPSAGVIELIKKR